MPLYDYKCSECSLEFDDLVSYDKRDDKACPNCGKKADRVEVNNFGFSTTLDAKKDTIFTNKEIDKIIGQDADKKRGIYEERRKKRWGDRKPEVLNIPKESDGKYSPVMHLGGEKEKLLRKEYSEALKEHRKNRLKEGVPQHEGSGFGKDNDSIIVKNK